jgi:GWxTD domain-containing protein
MTSFVFLPRIAAPARRAVLCLFLAAALSAPAEAQRERRPGGSPGGPTPASGIFVDAVVLPGATPDSSRIDVQCRIAWNRLVFVRSDVPHRDSAYVARVTLSAALTDSSGASRATAQTAGGAWTASYDNTQSSDACVLLRLGFTAPPGVWQVRVEASDEESDRNGPGAVQRVTVRVPDWRGPVAIGGMMPVELRPGLAPRALGYGRSLRYGRFTDVLVSTNADSTAAWRFVLRRRAGEGAAVVTDATLRPVSMIGGLRPDPADGMIPAFDFRPEHGAARVAQFHLPFDTLLPGPYEFAIRVVQGGRADSLVLPVTVLWLDMPATLRDPAEAASVLRFVLTREQIEEMEDLEGAELRAWIFQFWKAQDPTPGTEYNERMVEYYRRADEAREKFATLFTANGALTDRGRVYLLYGAPDRSDRRLEPDQPTEETWSYDDLRLSFRFVDRDRNGNLRLAE